MLGQGRGIICPERTRESAVQKAVGADTGLGCSSLEMEIRNTTNEEAVHVGFDQLREAQAAP